MTETPLPSYAGCPWPIDTSCIPADWAQVDESIREMAVMLASSSLHALSAYSVGGCPITIRPCASQCATLPAYDLYGPGGRLWAPGITASGLWVNNAGLGGSCGASCEFTLPPPVGGIQSIKVDGAELPRADFRLDNNNVLVYQGGGDCPFRAEQDLSLPDSEPGTWSITYLNARRVDRLAAKAAAHLAYEFALACGDSKVRAKCRLPANVKAITRMGMTMELNVGVWPAGFTGVQEVDAWIAVVNPRQRKGQTRLYSPDVDEPRIQGRPLVPTSDGLPAVQHSDTGEEPRPDDPDGVIWDGDTEPTNQQVGDIWIQ